MLFSKDFIVGRIIALIGIAVLLLGAAQMLWSRHKGVGLSKTGAYSVVRHPQFTGIIIVTVGLTVMVLTNSTASLFQTPVLWLMQILGYIALARYEEWRLTKKFGDGYHQYKQKVPFLFPIKGPSRIPETLFTVFMAILIFIVLLFLPYDLIRVYSSRLMCVCIEILSHTLSLPFSHILSLLPLSITITNKQSVSHYQSQSHSNQKLEKIIILKDEG